MRHINRFAVIGLLVIGLCAIPRNVFSQAKPDQPAKADKPQTDVPVKVVVLFSSGVGYFEHAGSVTGNAATELRFKTNQINDILKSLVLEDRGNGKVGAVVYPSQDPIAKTLRSFQIDITNNPPLAELLNQLRGAKVKINFGTEQLSGTILGLEKKPKAVGDKGQIEVWVLNLIAGADIRAVELNDVQKLVLEDAQLQEELGKALTALSQARDQDKKPVTLTFTGEGERQVRVGYVVETPVWKSSYRLLLPAKTDEKANLQGWAIIENQTDNDWNNVRLSLVSGRPISFIQELYSPLYIPRPVVQPELYASLRPQTYEGGMAEETEKGKLADFGNKPAAPAAARRSPEGKPEMKMQEQMQAMQLARSASGAEPQSEMDAFRSVASVASAAKVGELFEYTVGSVTLPRQRSAMIPIITDPLEVEKLSIYNASVLPRNPLNGARIKNTTGKHLLAGPVTVIEAGVYGGDARIDNVPPGQERLLSYGVDLQVIVDAAKNASSNSITTGKIVKGVLQVTYKHEYMQDYTAENKSEKDKVLIVEHPRRGGAIKLVAPEKPQEMTDAVYRFRQEIPAGKKATLSVKEETVSGQMIAILPADIGQLEVYRSSDRIPAAVREALTEAIKRKSALVDSQRAVQELERRRAEITADQNRIRENMRTAERNSQYYNRLLKKLNDQESELEKIDEQVDAAQTKLKAARKDLEDYLMSLTLEDK